MEIRRQIHVESNIYNNTQFCKAKGDRMIKIKASFEKQQELDTVIKLLKPVLVLYKVSKSDKGRFKKAYIELK